MYRINLYPEYVFRRQQARSRTMRLAVQASLMGVVLLVIGSLSLSALLLHDKMSSCNQQITSQTELLMGTTEQRRALALADEVVALRNTRIDWSPKLAALSERIDPNLILVEFKGNIADRGQPARLEIWGEALKDEVQISVFSNFVEVLRDDERFVQDFPGLQLGGIKDGKRTRFQVICISEQGGS